MVNSHLYCPVPWNSAAIRNNGDYRICCYSNVTETGGILKEPDNQNSNIKNHAVDDIRNHKVLKEIRQNFLENKWHSACVRCQTEEAHSQRSGRSHALERLIESNEEENFRERVFKKTKPDGEINPQDFKIHEMDIRFGNNCNLSCHTCGPQDSTGWYKDHYNRGDKFFYDKGQAVELYKDDNGIVRSVKDPYSWYKNINVMSQLPQDFSQMSRIYFAGGEPLINLAHKEFLENLVSRGLSKNISLEYNTNLSVLPKAITDLWSHFNFIGVGVSMDGYGDYHNYLRFPLDFRKLEANLDTLDNLNISMRGWLACTVSYLNISHLPDFIIWKFNKNYKQIVNNLSRPPISTHLLHHPHFLNLRMIPQKAKDLISYRLQNGMIEIRKQTDYSGDKLISTENMLKGLLRYMDSQPSSPHWSEYWERNLRLDQLRSHSFKNLDPELYEIFDAKSL